MVMSSTSKQSDNTSGISSEKGIGWFSKNSFSEVNLTKSRIPRSFKIQGSWHNLDLLQPSEISYDSRKLKLLDM